MKNQKKSSLKKGILSIAVILLCVVLFLKCGIVSTNGTNLIFSEDDLYKLNLDSNSHLIIEGMIGGVDVSEDGNKGVFFALNKKGEVEVREVDFKTLEINNLLDASAIKKGMWEIQEYAYTGKEESSPREIRYRISTNEISFLWGDALYCWNLSEDKVECALNNMGTYDKLGVLLALDGQGFAWLNEKECIFIGSSDEEGNSLIKYDFENEQRERICDGRGVKICDEKIIYYDSYYKNAVTWESYNNLVVLDRETLQKEQIYKVQENIIFDCVGDEIWWTRPGEDYIYIYNYDKGYKYKKRFCGKEIYEILNFER